MSQEHVDLWNQTAEAFDARYQAITEEQWSASTPCEGWTVKDLVEHAVGVQSGMVAPSFGIDVPEGAEWPAVKAAMSAGLTAESLEGTMEFGPMGTVPKGMLAGIATNDLLLHTWDLARAIGADETLPAAAVTACLGGMKMMPEEMRLGDGRFKPSVEVAEGADEQAQLIAFCGRQA